ncbi:ribose-phosphate pyrophosphokinase [Pricia antarctica]|uniref:ribose-phosphate diphosphokinase n=1 Tax=Pricia antarctica TaxID=641691 RepID=A0A1G7HPZ2_9FLAO|nr:ribose-phosphate diphosphokinase [Pricia antarctica]SDF02557.1 ribose-phosphate pyrophosphokinase [Pricia antarctica]
MKNLVFFSLQGNEKLSDRLALKMGAQKGKATCRKFPDGESYIRIHSHIKDKSVVLVCTLYRPDEQFLLLYFLCQTAKSLGAKIVCLAVPYLAYMRQDKAFNQGEGITALYFGKLISQSVDSIITIDPHLHRISSLSQVYQIPNIVILAGKEISEWILQNVDHPVLIGPDAESKQWVSDEARKTKAPYLVLQKIKSGDNEVKVSIPKVGQLNLYPIPIAQRFSGQIFQKP